MTQHTEMVAHLLKSHHFHVFSDALWDFADTFIIDLIKNGSDSEIIKTKCSQLIEVRTQYELGSLSSLLKAESISPALSLRSLLETSVSLMGALDKMSDEIPISFGQQNKEMVAKAVQTAMQSTSRHAELIERITATRVGSEPSSHQLCVKALYTRLAQSALNIGLLYFILMKTKKQDGSRARMVYKYDSVLVIILEFVNIFLQYVECVEG